MIDIVLTVTQVKIQYIDGIYLLDKLIALSDLQLFDNGFGCTEQGS